jgi:23S rRNA (cytosine1962-C5)-methyltransferase
MDMDILNKAIDSRESFLQPPHESAFRLFNGFMEGIPDLVIDIYASTVVIHNYSRDPAEGRLLVNEAKEFLVYKLKWLHAGIIKTRNGITQAERNGELAFGTSADSKISEHGVWYALDLTMTRDASFYLDTLNLRKWLTESVRGKSVLNTFAYTGSFGVAALAGGASRVVQVDRSRKFLDLARMSCTHNNLRVNSRDFISQDFFPAMSRMKQSKQLFDCVILDPPFFSSTSKGKVDLEHAGTRLINKVRPLVNDGGWLVVINNALYVSGKEYLQTLDEICKDGYLNVENLIPVPEEFVGLNKVSQPITDPSPFNHSTKIAVLRVKRKT